MKLIADPAISVPLNLSGRQASSTVSCVTESILSTEITTKGTNITPHQAEPVMNSPNKADDTGTVPTYGTPVFPMAVQILPLHPHLSDDDDDTMEDPPIEETGNNSSSSYTVVENKENASITKAPPDIINRDCRVHLTCLTNDEISI